MQGLDSSPLNELGWYVYGMPDAEGEFVVRALGPRALLGLHAQRELPASAARRYLDDECWPDTVRPG